MSTLQPHSHPLKWRYLKYLVEESGMEDPDVWIEDLRRYGPCSSIEGTTLVCESEDTDGVEASFSVIPDVDNNRIIIRHHY